MNDEEFEIDPAHLSRPHYRNVRHDVDDLVLTDFILGLGEADLRSTVASTSWCDIDTQFLLVFAVRVANNDLVVTSSVQCSAIENQAVRLDGEQRRDSIVLASFVQSVPFNFDGFVRLDGRT